MGARPGRVHHLELTLDDPSAVPDAVAIADGVWEVAPEAQPRRAAPAARERATAERRREHARCPTARSCGPPRPTISTPCTRCVADRGVPEDAYRPAADRRGRRQRHRGHRGRRAGRPRRRHRDPARRDARRRRHRRCPSARSSWSRPAQDYEHRGYVRALMHWCHERSRLRGHVAQVMIGIPYFYRRFGYVYAIPMHPYAALETAARARPRRSTCGSRPTATSRRWPGSRSASSGTSTSRCRTATRRGAGSLERDGTQQLVATRRHEIVALRAHDTVRRRRARCSSRRSRRPTRVAVAMILATACGPDATARRARSSCARACPGLRRAPRSPAAPRLVLRARPRRREPVRRAAARARAPAAAIRLRDRRSARRALVLGVAARVPDRERSRRADHHGRAAPDHRRRRADPGCRPTRSRTSCSAAAPPASKTASPTATSATRPT